MFGISYDVFITISISGRGYDQTMQKQKQTTKKPMKELPFRQIHMDFHTSPLIKGVGTGFNADEFIKTLKDANVNSINLFAKCHHGMYYYPTKIGTMHPGLNFDLFGEQMKACRREGIRACAYTTVVWNEDWCDRHPEWMQVSMDGILGVKNPYSAQWRWLCSNNKEHKEYLKKEFREIYDLYKPDGYWIDIILTAKCICKSCMAEMRQMGLDPASEQDVVRHDRLVQIKFMKEMYEYLIGIDPGLEVYFNGFPAEFDLIDDEKYSSVNRRNNMSFVDIESLPSPAWGYSHFPVLVNYMNKYDQELAMMNGKFHKSWADFGSLRNIAALEYECFRAISNGAKCCVGDQLHPSGKIDKSVYTRIGQVFGQIKDKEEWCSKSRKVSQIGVYASAKASEARFTIEVNTGTRVTQTQVGMTVDEGVYRMLTESHQLYDVIDYTSDIDNYDLLIIPDKVELPDNVADNISKYLKQGGKVLLTGKSGLKPGGMAGGCAKNSKEFALKDFGVEYVSEDEFCPRYVRITPENFKDILPMDYVMYEQGEVVKALPGSTVLAYVVDPYFNRAYDHFCSHQQTPPAGVTEKPCIVKNKNGNTIYIANPLFTDYALNGNKVYKDIVMQCVKLLLDKPRIIADSLPSTAEVTLRSQKGREGQVGQDGQNGRYILHLLHYIPHRRCKALDTIEDKIPLFNSKISVRTDKKPAKVYLAPQRKDLAFSYADGYTNIEVPEINGHQMVVFE